MQLTLPFDWPEQPMFKRSVGRPSTRPRTGVLGLAERMQRVSVRDVVASLGVTVVAACKVLAELVAAGKLALAGAMRTPHSKRPVNVYALPSHGGAYVLASAMRGWSV